MQIIGCDLGARRQTLAMLDTATGEVVNRTLPHEGNSVREFYSTLPGPGACRHRSDRIDEMVFAPDGRTWNGLVAGYRVREFSLPSETVGSQVATTSGHSAVIEQNGGQFPPAGLEGSNQVGCNGRYSRLDSAPDSLDVPAQRPRIQLRALFR
jgi:hypothetical protein